MNDNGYSIGKVSPTIFITIVTELLLLVVTIVMIVNILKVASISNYGKIDYNVEITNLRQSNPMLDKDGIEDVSFAIYDAVWLNADDFDIDVIRATIREDSIIRRTFRKDQIYQLYFIIDIPDLGQTYQITRTTSTKDGYNEKYPTEYRMMIYCPEESQKIYTNQTCIDRYAGQAKEIIQSFNLN